MTVFREDPLHLRPRAARSGGQLLVECLLAHGVTTAFGVPGESYLAVLDALYDHRNRLRLITTRHEGGAAFAAEAWGKLTGTPGIAFVTRGPGATNAAIGVHTAMQDSTPMILFVGQIGRRMRDREAFQEIDYRAFFGPVAKWVTEIDHADRIPELVARAFATATGGRPGPVVVALPEDMLRDMTEAAPADPGATARPAPEPGALDRLHALLARARRPLVLAGGGGWGDAGRQGLLEFAEKNALPVAVGFRCQDLIDGDSPCYIGDAGFGMAPYLARRIREADLILALNVRFGETLTDGWRLMEVPRMRATLIHAHLSAAELGKIYQPDLAIHAHPDLLMPQLAQMPAAGNWQEWRDGGRAELLSMRTRAAKGPLAPMAEICAWLDAHLPDDAIITHGAGNFAAWPQRFLTYRGRRRLLAPQSGAMGAGLPAALAAKAADPARLVLCFAGDGDFQMTMAEMGTAMQEGLQPVILLLNNGMYGTIRAHQEQRYPGRPQGTAIENPDYVALARAYGTFAARIEQAADFPAAFEAACNSGRGGLIEIMLDPAALTPFATIDDLRGS